MIAELLGGVEREDIPMLTSTSLLVASLALLHLVGYTVVGAVMFFGGLFLFVVGLSKWSLLGLAGHS